MKSSIVSILAFQLFFSIVSGGSALGQTSPQDPSLKLHFNFSQDFSTGVLQDVSGNGNNGTQFNPTNWITPANGVFGGTAGKFTYVGYISNDYPHIYPLSQYIGVTNLNGFAYLTNGTISFWAKFDTNTDFGMFVMDTGYNAIYASSPSAASNSWTIGRAYGANLSFITYPADGSTLRVVSWPDDTVQSGGYTPNLATTRFHLYTVTFDCVSKIATAYYDGFPYMTSVIDVPWIRIYGCSSLRWLCIGAMAHDGTPQWGDDNYPNSAYFVGKLDDVRIYNRTLSAADVQSLYLGSSYAQNLGLQLTGQQSLQLCWPTVTNATYQAEFQTNFAGGSWTALGGSVPGTGQTNCVGDSVAGVPSRFYRVRILAQ